MSIILRLLELKEIPFKGFGLWFISFLPILMVAIWIVHNYYSLEVFSDSNSSVLFPDSNSSVLFPDSNSSVEFCISPSIDITCVAVVFASIILELSTLISLATLPIYLFSKGAERRRTAGGVFKTSFGFV